MSKFKQRDMSWDYLIDCDLCIDLNIAQAQEIALLKRRVEYLESFLKDASFREWAESYDSWYAAQLNYDLFEDKKGDHHA